MLINHGLRGLCRLKHNPRNPWLIVPLPQGPCAMHVPFDLVARVHKPFDDGTAMIVVAHFEH
jgi:hypothetical protein